MRNKPLPLCALGYTAPAATTVSANQKEATSFTSSLLNAESVQFMNFLGHSERGHQVLTLVDGHTVVKATSFTACMIRSGALKRIRGTHSVMTIPHRSVACDARCTMPLPNGV